MTGLGITIGGSGTTTTQGGTTSQNTRAVGVYGPCGSCVFAKSISTDRAECRRFAPRPQQVLESTPTEDQQRYARRSIWPYVMKATDGCGEYVATS